MSWMITRLVLWCTFSALCHFHLITVLLDLLELGYPLSLLHQELLRTFWNCFCIGLWALLDAGNGGGLYFRNTHILCAGSPFPCPWNTGYRILWTLCIFVWGNCQVNCFTRLHSSIKVGQWRKYFFTCWGYLDHLRPHPFITCHCSYRQRTFAGRLPSEPRALLLMLLSRIDSTKATGKTLKRTPTLPN